MHRLFLALVAFLVLGLTAGCKTPPKPTGTDGMTDTSIDTQPDVSTGDIGPGTSQSADPGFGPIKDPAVKAEVDTILRDIHFAYDSANVLPNDAAVLQAIVGLLKKHPQVLLKIEGHCDERGTEEYNVALGSRRANAARDYLINLGIQPNRLFTSSFGEMQPSSSDHEETAWAQNRRAHFIGGEAQ